MVGLVLVSHSAQLAEAVKALAEQQTQGRAAIAAVGGTGDPESPFGTDAMAILEAIESVYQEDGVLVLMDLGSALMSTEMAIEFLEPERAGRIQMSAGPFVEGAMAAAVQASIGMDLQSVAREATEAMGPKSEALGVGPAAERGEPLGTATEQGEARTEVSAIVSLINHAGLHFGPAVLFVQTAAEYGADITVHNQTTDTGPVDAKRFNQVLSLGAEQGHQVEIRAWGEDAQAAIDALVTLAEAGFGELEAPPALAVPEPSPPVIQGQGRLTLMGLAASPGVAIGTAVVVSDRDRAVPRFQVEDRAAEWDRYRAAVAQAQADLEQLAQRLARELGPEQGRIFQAHAMALADPDLEAAVRRSVLEEALNAEAALHDAVEGQARNYEGMKGQRFQERAADVRDAGLRVLQVLQGVEAAHLDLPPKAVILAEDLAPSQTAALDRSRVVAFCTALGGPTAHTAILARSMGIPAVVGLGQEALNKLRPGEDLAVDGGAGTVIAQPDEATVLAYRAQQQVQAEARQAAWTAAQAAARTRDGQRVEVVANLATAAEARAALEAGAEGVGLLRTEFLFQDRTEPPSEDEQADMYRQVAQIMHPRPVIIRTLDIGGDKPAPYLQVPAEPNPFLGWRAIRISLSMPEFFKTQLRAILRAATLGNVRVMFPMVVSRAEVEQAQAMLAQAAEELDRVGIEHASGVPTGIMVEVPAAAQTADLMAPWVDFFSIGTNDLTQYTFAVDRTNARVAALADPLHPAVLRQIDAVIQGAHAAGRWVGLCGELAGQPEAIPILLGLGLDEFSMSAAAIPGAKALLARLVVRDAQGLAQRALALPDGKAVRTSVADFLAGL